MAESNIPCACETAHRRAPSNHQNLGTKERIASAIGGSLLAVFGLRKRNPVGYGLMLVGAGMIHRATTGYCPLYDKMGIDNAAEETRERLMTGYHIEHGIRVNRPVKEVYRIWRNFENLPRFMRHLKSVRCEDHRLSHWVAKAPAGTTVEWDAEVVGDRENELITWRSVGGDVDNAGSVTFHRTPDGKGTDLHVQLCYTPPVGRLGAIVARLFGENPKRQITEDLQRFKQFMEEGRIPILGGSRI